MSNALSLFGNIDRSGSVVEGWAFDAQAPDLSCGIEIWVDDRRVALFFAGSVARPDLALAYPSMENVSHGFSVDIRRFLSGVDRKVEFRFNRTNSLIPNGEFYARIVPHDVNIFEGVGGFYFYKDDSNATLLQLSRECQRGQAELDEICQKLVSYDLMTKGMGARFEMIRIGPPRCRTRSVRPSSYLRFGRA
jgi:hypothetical protein